MYGFWSTGFAQISASNNIRLSDQGELFTLQQNIEQA